MERMQEVADDLVAKLMEDEEETSRNVTSVHTSARETTKWYYRDPQGQEQGENPFNKADTRS